MYNYLFLNLVYIKYFICKISIEFDILYQTSYIFKYYKGFANILFNLKRNGSLYEINIIFESFLLKK